MPVPKANYYIEFASQCVKLLTGEFTYQKRICARSLCVVFKVPWRVNSSCALQKNSPTTRHPWSNDYSERASSIADWKNDTLVVTACYVRARWSHKNSFLLTFSTALIRENIFPRAAGNLVSQTVSRNKNRYAACLREKRVANALVWYSFSFF